MTKLVDVERTPGPFGGSDDAELVYRNVHADFRVARRGALSIRVGHFEVPFGLEAVVDTNGTLQQFTNGPNLGVKGDWGVAGHGIVGDFEYEVALQRGGGNHWKTDGNPHLATVRVGTRRDRRLSVGLSMLDGAVHSYARPDDPVDRRRAGLDLRWILGRAEVLAEYSFGEDDGADVTSGLAELDWFARDGAWIAYGQFRSATADRQGRRDRQSSATVGWRFEPDNDLALSFQYARKLDGFPPEAADDVFSLQIRRRLRY
jgi:hypothetical protein